MLVGKQTSKGRQVEDCEIMLARSVNKCLLKQHCAPVSKGIAKDKLRLAASAAGI